MGDKRGYPQTQLGHGANRGAAAAVRGLGAAAGGAPAAEKSGLAFYHCRLLISYRESSSRRPVSISPK